MTHEITITNGRPEMAFAGATPWHGLGEQKPEGVEWSINDWQRAAGMDWEILRSPAMYYIGGDNIVMVDGRDVLYRSDNFNALSVVSDKFEIVQPRDVLAFFDRLTKEAGFTLETAGTLFGGKRFWALAAIGAEAAIVDKKDTVKGYLLLSTSCDGSLATEARFTPIRVVCNNTLSSAIRGRADVRVRHRTVIDWNSTCKKLGIEMTEQFSDSMALFRVLAETEMTETDMTRATMQLFKPGVMDNGTPKEVDKALRSHTVTRVLELAADGEAMGADMEGVVGTAWGWYNSVTQYIDHEGNARSDDARLASAWFGKGAEIKERAIQMVVKGEDGSVGYRNANNSEALDYILRTS